MIYPFMQPTQNKLSSEINASIRGAGIDLQLANVPNMAEIMYRTLLFNRTLPWRESKHVFLAQTPQELLEIYRLRSTVFGQLTYGKDIPGDIKGLNFDSLDECSAILYTKSEGMITSTCRVIFDSDMHLPIEKTYSFETMKEQGKQIAELSRLARLNTDRALNQDFKYLVLGAYHTMIDNGMDVLVSTMIPEHYSFYRNFGGFNIEKELDSYIGMNRPFLITAWEVSEISSYFKRLYLGIKKSDLTPKGGNRLD